MFFRVCEKGEVDRFNCTEMSEARAFGVENFRSGELKWKTGLCFNSDMNQLCDLFTVP